MTDKLDDRALDRLFRTARTRKAWTEQAVTEQQLRQLYDLMKFGPTMQIRVVAHMPGDHPRTQTS